MEREFVDSLREALPPHPLLKLGVGDDAAVLAMASSEDCVVTTDLLADGTHFLASETDAELIGHKSLAVNLSDLAAMAATPVAVVASLLLPRDGVGSLTWPEVGRRLLRGMLPLAEEHGTAIAGGDTNVWPGRLAVSITAIGSVPPDDVLTRAGAQPGDRLLVTGELGGSIEGRHLSFSPRVREARLLNERYPLHAAMDLSDGLAIDLHRLAEASGVGAVVSARDVPASPAAERLALAAGGDALDYALTDGEDFELLIAAPPDAAAAIVREQPVACGVTDIGGVVDHGVWIDRVSGGRVALPPNGYEHR
ncbi:MAG: thiamine-phosphate kinase [Planctomycetota bacterium]